MASSTHRPGALAYRSGHIPGARYGHLERDLSGPHDPQRGRHPLPAPAFLAATFGDWGIDAATQVVAYDQGPGAYAARLWWLLRWLGHPAVAVLNGGFAAWERAGLPLSSALPAVAPRHFAAAPAANDMLVTTAALVRALRAAAGDALTLAGVGGRAMAAAGVVSPFSIDELAIVGVSAIPARLPLILRRIRQTADAVVAARPDVLVIIYSPDFTHRVARRVRARAPSIPIVDYVSPSVWAWRSGRARAMRAYVDCVLAILPFEPAAHRSLGGPRCVYVGHPLIERLADLRPAPREAERRRAQPPLVLVLPGSRSSEIRLLLSVFGDAIARASGDVGAMELVLPTMPHLAEPVRAGVAGWAVKPRITTEPSEKWAAFRNARAALATLPAEVRGDAHLVFTAHSIPVAMADSSGPQQGSGGRAPGGRYVAELTEAARLVAERISGGSHPWSLAYQSRSGPPSQPWLEPDVRDHLGELAKSGTTAVVVIPVGFVSDHMEVRHDLDVEAAQTAQTLGLAFARAATPGRHPRFASMITELVRERLGLPDTPGPDHPAPDRAPAALGTMGVPSQTCPADCCGRVR